MCICNAQSARKKIDIINDYKQEHDLDMYLIVESWLLESEEKKIGDLEKNGYKVLLTPRINRIGGGVMCLFKKELNIEKIEPPFTIKTMEFMELLLNFRSRKIRFVTIYRPVSTPKNRYTMTSFYKEFAKLMSHYNLCKDELIISGDFNFHMNKPTDPEANKFKNILSSFNLTQHVTEPTHKLGNTLDLLITRKSSILVKHEVDTLISDHNNILFEINLKKPECPQKTVKSRKLKKIKMEKFKKDVKNVSDKSDEINNLVKLVEYYNLELGTVLDNHAPEQNRLVSLRKPTPWTTEDIKPEKKFRRRLERKWRNTLLEIEINSMPC